MKRELSDDEREFIDLVSVGDRIPRRLQRSRTISPRVRFRILERDGYRCQYCGATAREARLVIDHIVPIARGGGTAEGNLVTACDDCNAGKSDSLLSEQTIADLTNEIPRLVADVMAHAETYAMVPQVVQIISASASTAEAWRNLLWRLLGVLDAVPPQRVIPVLRGIVDGSDGGFRG